MLIYGVYDVYANNSYDRVQAIDRYYLSKEKALEFILKEGGPDADTETTEWLVEIEVEE